MHVSKRALAAALAAASIATTFAAPALADAGVPAAVATKAVRSAWAQSASDLAPDPAVRFGVLANGMRYAILKNATPPGQASLRLRIDAGSLMERDDQTGIAHFLEHMAFNGSKNVPEGEMVKILQRHGLAFGPDTNASTNFDQTVYQLDLPETDDETLDTGLMLMRETASNLLLEASAIDHERGVILSEERSRESPGLRIAHGQFDFLMKGQLAPKRFPIGDTQVIKTAPRDRFADFYGRYYRPERATLVVVGDFDVDKMEAKIRARFSDWTAAGPDGSEPELGAVAARGPETRLMVEPGGPSSVLVSWINPPDLRPDSRALRKEQLIRQIGFAVLNRRFERMARAAKPVFLNASVYRYTNVRSADFTQLSATTQPGGQLEALAAIDAERRRLVQYGVSQAEIDREITEARTGLHAAVAGQATRRTPALAADLIDDVNDGDVSTSPSQDLALFEEAVKGLKAETVSAAVRDQFGGQGPLVFVTSPAPLPGGEQAVADAFARAEKAEIAPPKAVETKAWAYTDFGKPGTVAERKEISDLGTTFVRFANGVRLTVKPTKFRQDQILVSVRVGHGYRDLPKDRVTPMWASSLSFTDGGLGKLTAEELEQVMASKVAGVGLGVDETSFALSGRTRPADLEIQLQELAAYLTDAAWRPEPFERMRAYGTTLHAQLASTPGGVLSRDGARLLHGGDLRWGFPTKEQIDAARLDDLKALVHQPLSTGPIEVIVVGDVTVDEAVRRVASTFGALPARKDAAAPAEGARVSFPAPTATPVKLTHKGRADQAIAYVAWPTADFPSDPQRARALRLLQQVMQLRLTDEIREKQGVTYSPSSGLDTSWEFKGYGYLSASIEAPPEKLDGFFTTVAAIAKDLRDKPVSADELQRALKPRVEQLTKLQAGNEFWVGALAGAQTDPLRLETIRDAVPGLQRVTASDVQKQAQAYLRDERAWKLVVAPEGK
jgi:zinc protease